ncbi:nitroreductase/quinone reductase family protein [Microbacterium phosphatis]
MRADISHALAITPASSARERTIDITTTGARTGRPRRIEIWFYRVDGEIYLTSTPARRSWYVNLLRHPRFTFHLKHGVRADLDALALPVDDLVRARVLASVIDDLNQPSNPAGIAQPVESFERWMADSPLLRVTFSEGGSA